ncbi:hypothetical protein CVV65_06995 [Kyrpidia spormannii]|uniref:Uncharacterized protein n=1 Tax=Kyrpidia spormannii TaxID=2055160 RepID=A0A2K8N5V3_9BACL|nr:hypothetical protein CVV65_06995 [Kyrpidia spormannii]
MFASTFDLDWDLLWQDGFKKVKEVHDDDLDRMERYLRVLDRMHEMMMRREQLLMMMHYRQVMIRYNEMAITHMMHGHHPYHHKAMAIAQAHHHY